MKWKDKTSIQVLLLVSRRIASAACAVIGLQSNEIYKGVGMDRWAGKVCVVTGASAGIGAATCLALADRGLTVIGLARRVQLVENLRAKVQGPGSIRAKQCDVSDPKQVAATFASIEQQFGGIHALVNNAGVFMQGQCTEIGDNPLSEEQLLSTIDINLKGPIICTRHAVAIMKRHQIDGHIITINSIAGHYVPFSSNFNVYPATKHAITAFHTSLWNELSHFKSKIKTTSISPGLTATELMGPQEILKTGWPALKSEDVADAVVYALSTPPAVNINELTITPLTEKRL